MWHMGINSSNYPVGWTDDGSCPEGYIEVSNEVRAIHEVHDDYVWNGTTLVAPEVDNYIIINTLTDAVELYYDTVAQRKNYDDRYTCALRAGYDGVFKIEGTTFAIWMDNCNNYAYQVMSDVLNGLRGIPTAEILIGEFPPAPW